MQSPPQQNDPIPIPQASSAVPQPTPLVAQQPSPAAAPAAEQTPTSPATSPSPAQAMVSNASALQPTTATPSAVRSAAEIVSQAQRESKARPAWLAPFSDPLPIEPIDSSKKKTIFLGLTGVVALPVVYGGLTGLTGFAIWYHFTANKHLLDNPLPMLTFYGPVVGGVVLLLFFLAPFMFRRNSAQTSYRLDPNEHPAIFALIDAVASHVGAPAPRCVHASLDNAIRVTKGDDDQPDVTLGLPLIAVSSVRQTAGFLAGEFYQYSSHPSAKCWSFTSTIQGLFAKAAYDTGQEEQPVIEWGGTSRGPASVTFGFIPWIFERLAAGWGEIIKTDMVLDADRCQTRVSGSNTFAMSQLDCHLLDEVASMSREGFSAARAAGQTIENLPAFYANKLKILKSEQPDFVKRICQKLMEQNDGAKPPMSERIAIAQQHKDQGIFPVDKPSAALFQDFTGLCRRTTAQHYQTHFAAEITRPNVPPVTPLPAAADVPAPPPEEAARAVTVPDTDARTQRAAPQPIVSPAAHGAERDLGAGTTAPAAPATPVATPAGTSLPVAPAPSVSTPSDQPTSAPALPPAVPSPSRSVKVSEPAIPSVAAIPAVSQVTTSNGTSAAALPAPITPRPVVEVNAAPTTPMNLSPDAPASPTPVGPAPPSPPTAPAASPTPIKPFAVPDTSVRDYMACFMQTEVLTDNHELFLPLKEMAASKQPERSAQMLQTSRQRYEQLLVVHASDLIAFAGGIQRQKALQLARTISMVGLPIKADELGLSQATNAAVTAAWQDVEQQNNQLRERLRELRDQAVLRFVTATQLAATPVVAQSVGLGASELQAAQLAVQCLGKLKSIWNLIDELDQKHTQLYCLLFNLAGNEHLEDLVSLLTLTSGEITESVRQTLPHVTEFAPIAQAFGIAGPDGSPPDASNCQALAEKSAETLKFLHSLYTQSFTILAHLAERIEQHVGFPPLPDPAMAKARTPAPTK